VTSRSKTVAVVVLVGKEMLQDMMLVVRVVHVVRRPCSDFMDMLRGHINCRIIIIFFIPPVVKIPGVKNKD